MVTANLTVTGDKRAFRRLQSLSKRASLQPVAPAMLREFKKVESLAFGTKGLSTDDGAWPKLAESTLARKRKLRQSPDTLVAKGRMRRSLTRKTNDTVYDVSDTELRFGTRVPYAKYHQSLRPRKTRGGRPILPRRRMVSLTPAQRKQYALIFRRYILTGRRG